MIELLLARLFRRNKNIQGIMRVGLYDLYITKFPTRSYTKDKKLHFDFEAMGTPALKVHHLPVRWYEREYGYYKTAKGKVQMWGVELTVLEYKEDSTVWRVSYRSCSSKVSATVVW